MRGEVLHYDEAHGFGFITGEDGNRYTFRREDLAHSFPLSRGVAVEFLQSGEQAREVSAPVAVRQAPATLTATPTAMPAAPQRYGRNGRRNLDPGQGQATGLWGHFWTGITANYANFRGRARRKEYWGFALFYTLGMIVLAALGAAVDAAAGNFDYGSEAPVATIVIMVLALLAGAVPSIAIGVRRFHDIGLSGWFYFAMFLVGFLLAGSVMILAIVLGLIPSQKRENKWGPAPDGLEVAVQPR